MQDSNNGNKDKSSKKMSHDFFLDITGEVCPMTFVKTKLMLEKMSSGQIAEVHLKGTEPLKNVPFSVKEHGDTILSLEPLDGNENPETVHKLLVRRN